MMSNKGKSGEGTVISVEEKLTALHSIQLVDSEIDKIKILRGELPLEVQDLEDEIVGLETRIQKIKLEIKEIESDISGKKAEMKESEALIKRYEEQQMNVRNNREYDSLTKEVEYQKLEIELAEKRIREFDEKAKQKKVLIEESKKTLDERNEDLKHKKSELESIVDDTRKDEERLLQKSKDLEKKIEPRYLTAYKKIRANVRNGLAVVPVERDACGGCFNKIPPQRQLDIRSRKKIIVCEHCGRILVDDELGTE